MKKFIAMVMTAVMVFAASGCGINFGALSLGSGSEKGASEGEIFTLNNDSDKEDVFQYTGVDRIFYDNTQTVYSYLSSHDYLSAVHAVMQAEALRNAEAYTLQIKNGRVDENGLNFGFLHWQPIEFNALKTCFADRSLYTYAQNGNVPKLSDKGPLGLIFEDQVLDTNNLSIIITDMMENNFGASAISAELTKLLTEQEGVQITLYGFKCDGFSGNMSFPGYTTAGSVVKTVENYRGLASMYILVMGPSEEVEDFGQRLEENLPEEVKLNKSVYINGDTYPGHKGLGDITVTESLGGKISGGYADTLNYTVNAFPGTAKDGGLVFEYDGGNTPRKHRREVQLSFTVPIEPDSPFYEGNIDTSEVDIKRLDGEKDEKCDLEAEVTCKVVKGGLEAWKEGAERSTALNKITKDDVLHILVNIPEMPKGDYSFKISFTSKLDGGGWIDEYSASVYEYQSLSDILPASDTRPNHLVWSAGSTDILSRTLDLKDVHSLLSSSVTQEKTVLEMTFGLSR